MTSDGAPIALGAPSEPTTGPEDALARVGRALSHPLRVRIVLALVDLGEASPVDLARRFGAPLGHVSYHMRYLAELEVVCLEREVPRRGAVKHYYAIHPAIRLALPFARQLGATTHPT